jgi:hypothetical protein
MMKEYTYSEARQRFASVLDKAYREGAVRIKRRDGKVFIVRPEKRRKSALDVQGLNLQIDRQEILNFILAGRRKVEKSSG